MLKMGAIVAVLILGLLFLGMLASIWTSATTEYLPGDNSTIVYESITTGDTGSYFALSGDNVALETFTATSTHSVSQIKLKLWRSLAGPASLTVRLYHADGSGHPSGAAIDIGTANLAYWTTSSAGAWATVNLASIASVSYGQQYDVVCSAVCASGVTVNWCYNDTSAPSGDYQFSTDGGVTWAHA